MKLWNYDTKSQEIVNYPFLLPHEMVHRVISGKGLAYFEILSEVFPALHALKQKFCNSVGLPFESPVCLGLHGDGVPFTKKDSLEMLSYNFLSHPTANRIPFTGVSKRFVCACGCKGRCTFDSLLLVFAWSMRMLVVGVVSKFLPDGSEWQDHQKHLEPGTKLFCRAGLLQCRGDWPFLRTLFGFPSWKSEQICWLCRANKSDKPYTNCSSAAPWRAERYGAFDFLHDLRQQGVTPSQLFTIPGFTLSCVVLDWLHIVDLGVGADVLGCFFWELITTPGVLAGGNKEQRLQTLWN